MGSDAHSVRGHSMVGIPEGDNVIVASMESGEVHGQVIGFTSTVYKVNYLKIKRK